MKYGTICLVYLVLAGWAVKATAAESLVPPQRQAAILLKVLSFDYTLTKRVDKKVHIAVLYDDKNTVSSAVGKDMLAAFQKHQSLTLQDLPITVTGLPFTGLQASFTKMSAKGINTLYLCPGLDSQLNEILHSTRAKQLTVMTGVKRYVERGVSIGVILEGSTPRIMVNLTAMNAHSQKLSANLLRMANIVR